MEEALNSRTEEIFCAALEVAPEERATYLDRACAGDAGLRTGVDRMLSKLSGAEQFFKDVPAAVDISEISALPGFQDQIGLLSNPEAEVGKQIGPYKFSRRLVKEDVASFIWPSRKNRFGGGSPSRLSSSGWIPEVSVLATRS